MEDSRNRPSTELVEQAVANCILRHARAGDSIAVAFSGGIDSTVLLHATKLLSRARQFPVSALHIHHGLSPNADIWAEKCKSVCDQLEIPITIKRVDVPANTGEGTEAAARRLRHKALRDHANHWILLAHHADDQAETLIHNLVRGSGVRGAAAMPEARGRMLRPLLALERSKIAKYAEAHRLSWVEDESNADSRYTRNFIRRELFPAIESRFPGARARIAAAARRFGEAEALLDTLAMHDLGARPPAFPLPLPLFRLLPEARARNLLRAVLGRSNVQPPDERRLVEFVRQLQTAAKHKSPRLDLGQYSLWCAADHLHIRITT